MELFDLLLGNIKGFDMLKNFYEVCWIYVCVSIDHLMCEDYSRKNIYYIRFALFLLISSIKMI